MASPSTQVALAVFGLLLVAGAGALLLPQVGSDVERHQLDDVGAPTVPGLPGDANPLNADEVELQLSPGGGATRVAVRSPNDAAKYLLEITVGPTGTQVHALEDLRMTSGSALPVTVDGDLARDPVVTFRLPSANGADYWVKLDRSTAPSTLTLAPAFASPAAGTPAGGVLPTSIQPPLAWRGDAADPTEVALFVPGQDQPLDQRNLLLVYQDHGDGTSSVSYVQPGSSNRSQLQRVPHNVLAMHGSPLEASWSLRLSPPGQPPTTVAVPLGVLRQQLAAGGVDLDSYLDIGKDALYDVNAYKAASDGPRTLAPAELDGQRYLNAGPGSTQRIFVDVPERQVTSVPSILLEASAGPAPTQVAMVRGATANGYVRHEATVPAAWLAQLADGATVKFSIAYTTTVAKLVTERLVDDNHGAYYLYRADRSAPAVSAVDVTTPDPAQPHVLQVSWTAADGGSGVASYKVEKRRDGAAWEPWITSTANTVASFTGAPGRTFGFRVTATDAVGNIGAGSQVKASRDFAIPAGDGAENRAPTVQLLQPTGGEEYAGVPTLVLKWRASDPDGTVPVINLYYSADGGQEWLPLASPTGTQYTWTLAGLPSGDYRVKVEATDGSLANQDTSQAFHIDTTGIASAATIGGANAQALPGTGDGGAPGENGDAETQGGAAALDTGLVLILALVLIGCAAGVAVWRWKTR